MGKAAFESRKTSTEDAYTISGIERMRVHAAGVVIRPAVLEHQYGNVERESILISGPILNSGGAETAHGAGEMWVADNGEDGWRSLTSKNPLPQWAADVVACSGESSETTTET